MRKCCKKRNHLLWPRLCTCHHQTLQLLSTISASLEYKTGINILQTISCNTILQQYPETPNHPRSMLSLKSLIFIFIFIYFILYLVFCGDQCKQMREFIAIYEEYSSLMGPELIVLWVEQVDNKTIGWRSETQKPTVELTDDWLRESREKVLDNGQGRVTHTSHPDCIDSFTPGPAEQFF